MSKVINSALELIGNTPLLNASRYAKNAGIEGVTLLTKLEYLNPAGSVKDRVALAMIEDAEKKGELKPGAMIIEPTSGNTGIGLAAVAVAKGYRAVLTLPDTMSVERRNLLKAYGVYFLSHAGMSDFFNSSAYFPKAGANASYPLSSAVKLTIIFSLWNI